MEKRVKCKFRFTDEDISIMLTLKKNGRTNEQIAAAFGATPNSIYKVLGSDRNTYEQAVEHLDKYRESLAKKREENNRRRHPVAAHAAPAPECEQLEIATASPFVDALDSAIAALQNLRGYVAEIAANG